MIRRRSLERHIKRIIDVTGAGIGLAIAGPVIATTGAAIRVTMGSPILFRQMRPGLHGRPFELIKFRTMTTNGSGTGPDADASRLTPLGRCLRKYSLDELPTLWNVLRGDMSLVGPRPLMMQYLDRYTPEQALRHDVEPGVTGWAQVNGRNSNSWDKKFELDRWYVDNWSLLLDLKILWSTIFSVISSEGVSASGHATMPEFMGNDVS